MLEELTIADYQDVLRQDYRHHGNVWKATSTLGTDSGTV